MNELFDKPFIEKYAQDDIKVLSFLPDGTRVYTVKQYATIKGISETYVRQQIYRKKLNIVPGESPVFVITPISKKHANN